MSRKKSPKKDERRPPIDSEVPIKRYAITYGFGNVDDVSVEKVPIRIAVYDARVLPSGQNMKNELLIVKDALYPRLPDAYQETGGAITFFAYESQLTNILRVLESSNRLWLKTKGGKVMIITEARTLSEVYKDF